MDEISVESKKGIFSSLQMFILVPPALFPYFYIAITLISQNFRPFYLLLLAMIMGPVCTWFLLKGITMKLSVTLDFIEVSDIFGKRKFSWSEVKEIWVQRSGFEKYSILLTFSDSSRRQLIFTNFAENTGELNKAIVEAGSSCNPPVEIKGIGARRREYSAHAFGIFSPLESSE